MTSTNSRLAGIIAVSINPYTQNGLAKQFCGTPFNDKQYHKTTRLIESNVPFKPVNTEVVGLQNKPAFQDLMQNDDLVDTVPIREETGSILSRTPFLSTR